MKTDYLKIEETAFVISKSLLESAMETMRRNIWKVVRGIRILGEDGMTQLVPTAITVTKELDAEDGLLLVFTIETQKGEGIPFVLVADPNPALYYVDGQFAHYYDFQSWGNLFREAIIPTAGDTYEFVFLEEHIIKNL